MSLKLVHIIFISASALLSFWFGVWSVNIYRSIGGTSYLVMGITSLGLGVLLIFYGKRFLQKLKHVSFL